MKLPLKTVPYHSEHACFKVIHIRDNAFEKRLRTIARGKYYHYLCTRIVK